VRPVESNSAPPSGPEAKLPGAVARSRIPTFVARLLAPNTVTVTDGTMPKNPGATMPNATANTHIWANVLAVSQRAREMIPVNR
jgi:hypothetical protein